MASNKKTKKPDASYMEIDLAGKTHRVDRLDMSDEEWRKTKQTAIDKGVFKFAHDREAVETETSPMTAKSQPSLGDKAAAAKTEEIKARADAQDPNEMVEVSDAKGNKYTVKRADVGRLDAAKLEEQSKNVQDGREGTGTLGGKLKSVAAKLFSGATPTDQGEALVDSIQLPKTTPAAPAAKPAAKMQSLLSSEMAAEAAAAPPEVSQQVVNGPQVTPRPQSMAGAVVPPPEPGLLQKINIFDPNSQINQSIGETIGTRGPSNPPVPDGPMLVDPPPPGAAQMAPTAGANNPIVPPAATGSSSVKMSASSKGVPDPSMPPLVDRRAQLEADTAAVNAARMQKAEADAEGLKAEAAVARDGLKAMTDLELERRTADNVAQEHVRKAQAAYTKTVEEMAAPEKIDPDRWWKSRNTAQKIFAVVSAGLTRGATLGMFQDAISRDIQVQQHDITNARLARGEKANAQHNVYQMARNNGLDERAAYITAEANAWANIERASKLAGMTAKAPSVIAAAQEQAALANQQKTEKLVQLDNHLETQALERKKLFLEERKVESIISMNSRKGQGAPKPPKLRGLAPKQTTDLGDLERGKVALEELQKSVGQPGFFGSMWRKVTDGDIAGVDLVPWASEAKNINAQTKMVIQLIAPGLGSGTLQRDDTKRWDDIMGRAGDFSHAQRIQMVLEDVKRTIESRKDAYKKAGFSMQGFEGGPPPTDLAGGGDEDAMNQLLQQE